MAPILGSSGGQCSWPGQALARAKELTTMAEGVIHKLITCQKGTARRSKGPQFKDGHPINKRSPTTIHSTHADANEIPVRDPWFWSSLCLCSSCSLFSNIYPSPPCLPSWSADFPTCPHVVCSNTISKVLVVNRELDRAGFLFKIPQWLSVALRKEKSKPLDNLIPVFPL